jgi:hypothetical protein
MAKREDKRQVRRGTSRVSEQVEVLNAAQHHVDMQKLESEMGNIRPASASCGLCMIVVGKG